MVTPAIRAATVDDTEALAGLWVAARSARRAEAGLDAGLALAQARADLSERLDDDSVGAVAEDGAGLVAMAVAVPARADDGASSERLRGVLHVSFVAVRPDRWGQGLAEVGTSVASACTNGWGGRRPAAPRSTRTASPSATSSATCDRVARTSGPPLPGSLRAGAAGVVEREGLPGAE